MAISQIQYLFLLVSLFILPALSVEFRNCTFSGRYSVSIKSVNASPDPVEYGSSGNIIITANTSKNIPEGVIIFVELIDLYPVFAKTFALCDVTTCPVTPGPVKFTFPDIPAPRASRNYLTGRMTLVKKEKYSAETMMCVMFHYYVKSPSDYASA